MGLSPKNSRPSSRNNIKSPRMPLSRRLRYASLFAFVAVLVIIYVATGETSTRNSEFYRKTLALMESKGQGEAAPAEDTRKFPEKPLHRAGGLHWAEVEGHGSLEERRRGKKVQGPQALPEGMMGNPKLDDPSSDNHGGRQNPMMEDDALKDRLKQAEEDAKKSADDKYRELKDIEAEVEKDRVTRVEDQKIVAGSTPALDDDASPTPSEKSVAGRKKMLADDSPDAAQRKPTPKYPKKGGKDGDAEEEQEEDPEAAKIRSMLAEILSRSPITIFSKSYCPHSKKAKNILLNAHTITPTPFVVELDLHPNGPELQALLMKTTGRRTVPNVLVNGKSIGGGDETEMLWKSGEIPARIKQMAGKRVTNVAMNFAFGKEPPA